MPKRQMLLTKATRKQLPPLYATENVKAADKVLAVKFFNPYGAGTWYAVEFDGEDTFFGLVTGLQVDEWGYFSLDELETLRGPWGLQGIERDTSWTPIALRDAVKYDHALKAFVEAA